MDIIEQLEQGLITTSTEETTDCAQALARVLPENIALAFHGDLGVGKTTFIRGLAREWDIKEAITSPTYTYYNLHKGERNLVHLDAYRLEGEEQAEELYLEDFLVPPYCLAVEWPDNLGSFLPKNAWHLYLSIIKPNHHQVLLKRPAETDSI